MENRALLDSLLSEEHENILSKALIEEFSKVVADKRISRYGDAADALAILKIRVPKGVFVHVKSKFRVLNSPDDVILRTTDKMLPRWDSELFRFVFGFQG